MLDTLQDQYETRHKTSNVLATEQTCQLACMAGADLGKNSEAPEPKGRLISGPIFDQMEQAFKSNQSPTTANSIRFWTAAIEASFKDDTQQTLKLDDRLGSTMGSRKGKTIGYSF